MSEKKIIHDEIEEVAYELFENSGRMYGCELENWLAAEKIVMERRAGKGAQDTGLVDAPAKKKASGRTGPGKLRTPVKSSATSSATKKKKSPPKKKPE